MFDEVFSFFAALSARTGAGLGFRSRDIAAALSFGGPAMLTALLSYPFLQRHISAVGLWRLSAGCFTLVYPLFSILPELNECSNAGKWTALLCLVIARYVGLVVAHISYSVLVRLFDTAI